jgi:hypothetical protein
MLAALSEFLLGRETREEWAAALAAIFSATSSATVLGGPSAISASDVTEVMLDRRLRPHSSQPTSPDDRSMSKLPLSLLPASRARIAGLAGELGLDESADSLPGGGEVGGRMGAARAYASGPHHDPDVLFEFSLPDRWRSTELACIPMPEVGLAMLYGVV